MEYKFEGIPRLMNKISKDINLLRKYIFSSDELLSAEIYFLGVINENPGLTQLELSILKGESKNLTVKYISSLEAKGLIYKKEEEKKKKIYLSEMGEKARNRVLSMNDDICFEIFSEYSEADIGKWIEMTRCLHNRIRDLSLDREKKKKIKEIYSKNNL